MMIPVLIFAGTFLFTAAVVVLSRLYDKKGIVKMNEQLESLADNMGLNFKPGELRWMKTHFPEITGESNGRFFKVDFPYETRSTGNSSYTEYYTRITVDCPTSANIGFEITEEHIFARLAETLGWEDAKVGDEQFDGKFRLTGKDKDILKILLGQEERELLLSLREHAYRPPKIKLKNGKLVITELRKQKFGINENNLKAGLTLLNNIAGRLDEIAWTGTEAESFWESGQQENLEGTQ